jgi:hypothetical protein
MIIIALFVTDTLDLEVSESVDHLHHIIFDSLLTLNEQSTHVVI